MIEAIFFTTFAAVCVFTIGMTMKGESTLVRERIESLSVLVEQDIEMVTPELTDSLVERVLRPWLGKVAQSLSNFLPANAVANAGVKLERAGNPGKLTPMELIGLKALSCVIFPVGAIIYAVFANIGIMHKLIAVTIGAVIGILLPDAILARAVRQRHRMIRKCLADCLDLLVVCAEAGLGFDGAAQKMVERTRGPLADEFERVMQDMSLGRSRMDALEAMAARVDMPELTTFVAAINQADVLGVSMARVLRVQADSMRVNRNLRAREIAGKMPVKMLFPLVFFIFPAMFVVLLGPAIMSILRALTGTG